ncbi:MAG: hypothetical protein ACOVQ2_05460 [Flavobacterium sp.]|jgi:hypothetical protein
MKKSKFIKLVLISTVLASCNKEKKTENSPKVFMRSDSTASYSRAHVHSHHSHHSGIANAMLWYYAFRPYGQYNNGSFQRAGFYSNGLQEHSNIGSNGTKNGIVRGGFGKSSNSVSS